MRKAILITLILTLSCGVCVFAKEQFTAALEQSSTSPGNPVYLYVKFFGSQDAPRPEIPAVDGLNIRYVGPQTEITVINGKVSQSITHTFLVMPRKEGEYKLGPFFIEYNGQAYSASPVTLKVIGQPVAVSSGAASGYNPAASAQAAQGTGSAIKAYAGDVVFIEMSVSKEKVYINELVPLTIKLYAKETGLREIEYPVFEYEGFSAGDWQEPEKTTQLYKGSRYNVLVFRRDMFGIKDGNFSMGPARVNCKVVSRKEARRRSSFFGRSIFDEEDFFSDAFGRYEVYPIELESDPIQMTVLQFPEAGKPPSFEGAVGNFSMEVSAGPKKVKVGDPVTVKMVISGTGNLDTVTAPKISAGEEFKMYVPQVTKKGRTKIYELIMIPKTDKVKNLPPVVFSFFNPDTGQYKTVQKEGITVEVQERPESEKALKMVSMMGQEETIYPAEKLGEDIIHIKESMGKLDKKGEFLYTSWLFWAVQAVPFICLVAFFAAYREKERIRTDRRYARGLKAPRSARVGLKRARNFIHRKDTKQFSDTLFKTMQEYLGNKFNLSGVSITSQIVDDKLRPAGCDEEILGMIQEVFAKCDLARYASQSVGMEECFDLLEKTKRIIDHLERMKL